MRGHGRTARNWTHAAREALGALAAAALLAACAATAPPAPQAAPDGAAAFARGAYSEAATSWQREALEAAPQDAAALRVRAADAWLLAGDPASAEALLKWIVRDELTPPDRARLDLVLADLALRAQRPDEAAILLSKAEPALPAASRGRYDRLQAELSRQLDSPLSRNLADASRIMSDMAWYDPGASVDLMRALESVSSRELAVRADNPRAERQLTGWLDLALVIRQNLVIPDQLEQAIAAWKGRHPYHLLTTEQALDTWLRYRQDFRAPGKTAVLLPATGRLRNAGAAIRDGLMSAYLAQPGAGEVLLLPTGDEPQSAVAAYFGALDSGATRIVGPLRKESVEAMLNLAGLATPVLALNDLPAGFVAPTGLEGQFSGLSLSQDAETAAVARHAAASGFRRAFVLAPESVWGERMAGAFEDEFLREDRQILVATRYLESESDHSGALERALQIDESKARRRRLENTLQTPLEFEPTRRNDIDVIFMAASPNQAKSLRPQLRFLDAGDIPVYATGRVYSGQPDPAGNQDLDGLRFPVTRWELDHADRESLPAFDSLRGGALAALFALGQDAWNLLPWMELMRKDPDFRFPGQSGDYRMAADGSLIREPAFAEFRGGRPQVLAAPEPAQSGLSPETPARYDFGTPGRATVTPQPPATSGR